MRDTVAHGGFVVLVGGHSRGVGKTLLIEQWLAARSGPWIAVKMSAHRHAAEGADVPLIEEATVPTPATQTGRYLAAGAARAFLVRAPDNALPRAAAFIERLRRSGARVIVESNRLVRSLHPDLLLFVVDPTIDDWKPSSVDCLRARNVILCRHRREFRHDRHFVTDTLGDGAALGPDWLHRVALPRGVAAGLPAAD